MNLTAIIVYLTSIYYRMLDWFNNGYYLATYLLPNFFNLVTSIAYGYYTQAIAYANAQVAIARLTLALTVNTLIADSQKSFYGYVHDTRVGIEWEIEQLRGLINTNYAQLNIIIITQVSKYGEALQAIIQLYLQDLTYKTNKIADDLRLLGNNFSSFLFYSGLLDMKNRLFLNVFLNHHKEYLEAVFYENLFNVLRYVLAYALTREDRDVEEIKPRITDDTAQYINPDIHGVQ
jgi:hypothetical protein